MNTIYTISSIKKFSDSFLAMFLMSLPFYIIVMLSVSSINDEQATFIVRALLYTLVILIAISGIVSFISHKIIMKIMSNELSGIVLKNMRDNNIHGTVYFKFRSLTKMNNIYIKLYCAYSDMNKIHAQVSKELKSYEPSLRNIFEKKVNIFYSEIEF